MWRDGTTAVVMLFALACKTPIGAPVRGEPTISRWAQLSLPAAVSSDLDCVWGADPDDVWAGGELLVRSLDRGQTWSEVARPDAVFHAAGIWGASRSEIFIASSTLLDTFHSIDGGSHWQSHIGAASGRFALWGSSAQHVLAVGSGFSVEAWDGITWRVIEYAPVDSQPILNGIHGIDRDHFWAVGEKGAILAGKGETITRLSSPISDVTLWAIWSWSTQDVVTVGYHGGPVLRTRDGGASWEVTPLPVDNDIYHLWGSGPNDLYLVGSAGLILHSSDEGQTWQRDESGTTENLYAVYGFAPDDVYVVGDRGTILHRTAAFAN